MNLRRNLVVRAHLTLDFIVQIGRAGLGDTPQTNDQQEKKGPPN
jgi:hypothetical protein